MATNRWRFGRRQYSRTVRPYRKVKSISVEIMMECLFEPIALGRMPPSLFQRLNYPKVSVKTTVASSATLSCFSPGNRKRLGKLVDFRRSRFLAGRNVHTLRPPLTNYE